MHEPRILATDLDGTLIPFDHLEENRRDLAILARELDSRNVNLVFVTGRHFESIERAIELQRLPLPQWIICNVGTTIYQRHADGRFEEVIGYCHHLDEKIAQVPIAELTDRVSHVAGLRLQEPEKQGRFKLSFYCAGDQLAGLHDELEKLLVDWECTLSRDHEHRSLQR